MSDKLNSSSIDKVLTILESVSKHPTGISLADLAKNTKIAKNNRIQNFRNAET
ncbi:helix-turn-helix domain-containing protein [Budvicia aquatica]|nr:helix-turn-helix domain-containing protein [Budvicia aquatica]